MSDHVMSDDVVAMLPSTRDGSLLMTEIYASVQGESTFAGVPFVLVRLARCNLRCVWCDSEFTFRGGVRRTVREVLKEIRSFGLAHVLVTGGEPLLQRPVLSLMAELCDGGSTVLLETGGSLDIGGVDPRVHRILDLKCPGSGEHERNRWENLPLLTARDEVKLVVADRADYEWARDVIRRERLDERCGSVLLSPVWGDPELAASLAEWIVLDRLPARLNLQLHKVLWPTDDRRR